MPSFQEVQEWPNYPLFRPFADDNLEVVFDKRGFCFSDAAQEAYNAIRGQPHLYWAWNLQPGGDYIGRSYQQYGRWRRQHAYHLGTLAYHLLSTYDPNVGDQNHLHWLKAWFNSNNVPHGNNLLTAFPINVLFGNDRNPDKYTITLKSEVRIAFILLKDITPNNFQAVPKDFPPVVGNWEAILHNERDEIKQKLRRAERETKQMNMELNLLNRH